MMGSKRFAGLAAMAVALFLLSLPLLGQPLSGSDSERFRLALNDFRAGRLQAARDKLLELERNHPQHFDVQHLLAIVLDLSGDPGQANRHFRKAVQINPQAIQARTNLGANLNRLGRVDEAVQEFRAVLEIDPANATAHFNLGTIHLARRRYREAAPWLEKAYQLQPQVYETGYQWAFCLFALDRHQEVTQVLDSLGTVAPSRGEFHLLKALNRRALGQEGYQRDLEQSLRTLADSPQAHAQVAALLLGQGMMAEALPILRAAVERFPASDEAWLNLARAEMAMGEDTARSRIEKALSLRQSAQGHHLLGELLDGQDDFAAAASHYQRALELENSESSFYELGYFFLRHWNWETAERVFASGAERFPESGRLLLGWGATHLAQGDDEAAARAFLQASQSPQTALPALRMLAECFARTEDQFDQAVRRFEDYYRRHPQDARAGYFYALGVFRQSEKGGDSSDLSSVIEVLEESLRRQPDFFPARLLLGEIHFQQQDWEAAQRELQQACQTDPQHAQCRYTLALALQRSGRPEQAQEQLRIYQQLQARQSELAQQRMAQTKKLIVEMDSQH
ncbi:MAG TPA: tetratricopeptide repeat protein [Acidobacteriota bacterium]|nr:tetratricopeptide repeat protein [Acidobacteriota bacterium]